MLSSHEIDDVALRLTEWLVEVNEELDHPAVRQLEESLRPSALEGPATPVGILQLTEAFTALRHETKLQTKSERALRDDVQTGLSQLAEATAAFGTAEQNFEGRAAEKAEQFVAPMVNALIDVDEALSDALDMQGRRSTEQMDRASKWRFLARIWPSLTNRGRSGEDAERHGLRLLHKRLQRALEEANIERLRCQGKPVDCQTMRVVEAVQDDDATAGTVLQEIRPGYRRNGKLIRPAEVRTAK